MNPMQFLYALSPAAWLRIAIASLLLALACVAVLLGYRINVTFVTPSAKPPTASPAPQVPNLPSAPRIVPPQTVQTHALAPDGILNPHAEFVPVTEFEDTVQQPAYVLPLPVAPVGLLDPNWKGNTP